MSWALTSISKSSSAKPSCSHCVPAAVNSRATLSISLCTYSAPESTGFGDELPGRWKKGNSFQPGLLLLGNHRWAAKNGREEHDKGVSEDGGTERVRFHQMSGSLSF